MRLFSALALASLIPLSAIAQDRPNTILVMDGSGSMWGQIDGVAKITIAQEVVTGLLNTLPENERLGLTVYGHRERGSCTDIETVVAPAEGTREAIAAAVQAIKPLGKTPMTDAVIAAAEALRYTEDSATVILVSDGVETCNPDPCAAARLLEEAAIDFTAHVIGFDVGGDAEAIAQMQCIAAETGGMFLSASNAGELATALTTVVEEPEPVVRDITFVAVIGEDQRQIDTPVLWDINDGTGLLIEDVQDNPLDVALEEGDYVASAYSVELETSVDVAFVVATSESPIVTAVFAEPAVTATLDAPDSVPGGSTFDVGWTGPDQRLDNVSIYPTEGTRRYDHLYTRDGSPLTFIAPFTPGTYELRYMLRDDEAIATRALTVTEVPVGLDAPAEVSVGADFDVTWTGPDAFRDNVQIGPVEATRHFSLAYTREGPVVTLTAPSEPGDYELRYVFRDLQTIYTQPIAVVDIQATVTASETAVAGSTIRVDWTGPDYQNDYIGIGAVGAEGAETWENYAYTNDGSPVDLLMPLDPGDYAISYFLGQDRRVIATTPISVTPVTATLTAPATAIAGDTVRVDWTGPDYQNDYIGIGKIGADGSDAWENFTYTNRGNPAELVMPTEPGDYQISYFVGQDRTILATVPISVTKANATLDAPDTAVAGSTLDVAWTGPDYPNDYIGIGRADASGSDQWQNFVYTERGTPAQVLVPTAPGDYLIRYFIGQDRAVLDTHPLTVTALPEVQLIAAETAPAGSALVIGWDGPAYDGDYIGVGKAGATGSDRWEAFAYAADENPVTITLPDEPGAYVITYFLGQDRTEAATRPLTIE